jgi:hypothetical protein
VSEDLEGLPASEKARVTARDRKVRGPRVVSDNPGLRKLTLELAEKLRQAQKKAGNRPPT